MVLRLRWRCSVVTAAAAVLLGGASAWAGDLRVVDAARQRDRQAVERLIKSGADVRGVQPDGATALHWAAQWGDLAMVDALLQSGAKADAANEYGATPLWLASLAGDAPVVERLLKGGADPNLALASGETPLMSAARAGSAAAVGALLGAGAKAGTVEKARGQSALMWAAAEGHAGVAGLLLDKGADVNQASASGFTPLMFAARQGDLTTARLLVERGARVNAVSTDGSSPLLVAVVRGHVPLAEYFISQKANVNAAEAGYTPLHWAVGTWETSTTFDYRLTEGEWAALAGIPSRAAKLGMIKTLLAAGADVNALTTKTPPRYGFTLFGQQQARIVGATPFFLAAIVADVEVMKLLQAAGAKTNLADADGNTPLMIAAGRCRVDNETHVPESAVLEATRYVLGLGADVKAVNNVGETALHAAALAGLESVVSLLVERGSELNAKTKAGKTPLATAEGTVVAMQLVVRPGTVALLKKLGGVTQ